jgi:peptidyl-prolyl cis-trans isomerase SurA
MKNYLIIMLAVCTAVLAQGRPSTAGASVVVDRVIAVVNDEIITMSDLQREAGKTADKTDERLLLEDMINRKLQMAAAKRAGMDVTEKEVSDAVEDIMKRNSLDRRQFEAALAKEGLTLDQYRAELKEQMTLSRVFNKFVRSGLTIDEGEIRAYYERNPKAFELPEEIRVRQILVKVPENASRTEIDSLQEKAKKAAERAKSGENFLLLVREFSESAVASQDGDLGFMQREHVLPEIERAAASLKPGEIAGPVRSSLGFHVIRLEEIRRGVKPYEKVKDEITNLLYNQKLENTYRSWLQTLRNESHIENKL